MVDRLVVVGGDAAGMSAASQAKRLRKDGLEVVAFERSHHVSYSACGIPYWVAGDVAAEDDLIARTPEQHRDNGVDLRMRTEVESIDLDRGEVRARDAEAGESYLLGFDQLVIATGARPIRPDLPGVDAQGIFAVQTLDDGRALIDGMAGGPRRAVVVGGGYIGIEMAEAMVRRGLEVTVVEQAEQPMSTLDPDMGALVHHSMEGMGIDVRTDTAVEGFETGPDGRVRSVTAGAESLPADLVILGIGVRPGTELAEAAGLPLGSSGGLRTDLRQRVSGFDHLWAGGDCVETRDLVTGAFVHIPLGTHANKQGRVIGTNIGGGYLTFPGVVRTAVTKVCDLEIGRTGLLEQQAAAAGFDTVSVRLESSTRAGYFPGAAKIVVKLLAERRTGRLLGAQIVGREGAAKRIDICAIALTNGMTVEETTMLDLGYAPPFSPVLDPVLIAARKAAEQVAAG